MVILCFPFGRSTLHTSSVSLIMSVFYKILMGILFSPFGIPTLCTSSVSLIMSVFYLVLMGMYNDFLF